MYLWKMPSMTKTPLKGAVNVFVDMFAMQLKLHARIHTQTQARQSDAPQSHAHAHTRTCSGISLGPLLIAADKC